MSILIYEAGAICVLAVSLSISISIFDIACAAPVRRTRR
jgi:hypothetical protein